VFAPVSEGDTVGSVKFYYKGKLICEEPISAAESVAEKRDKPNSVKRIILQFWENAAKALT
jgi:hypothetical protein